MKKSFAVLAIAASIGTSVGAFAIDAASQRAHVPFSFKVGNKTMPAGDYRFTATESLLRVESLDGKNYVSTIITPSFNDHVKQGKLVFQNNASGMELSQLFQSNSARGEKVLTKRK